MSVYTNHSTPRETTRINPNATLRTCDACHEHAPRFITGVGVRVIRLCPSCAVATDLSTLHPIEAERLQAALIAWITTPNPRTDMASDDDFYAQFGARTWGQQELDLEAERQARKALVASYTADSPDDRFWTALTEMAA